MNERAQKLLDVARSRLFNDEDITKLHILKNKLVDLLSPDEQGQLNDAWQEMRREYALEKWDEDFLKVVAKEDMDDVSREERMDNLFDSLTYKGANRYNVGTAIHTPFTSTATIANSGPTSSFTQSSLVEAVKAIQEEMKNRQLAELESTKSYYDECEEDK